MTAEGRRAALPNLSGTRERLCARQSVHGRGCRAVGGGARGSGGNASDGARRGAADEASLARRAAWGLGPLVYRTLLERGEQTEIRQRS